MTRIAGLALLAVFVATPTDSLGVEVTFKKSKQVVQEADKSKERDVDLVFLDDKIIVKHRNGSQVYAEIPNSSVNELTYEMSKHARVKTAILLSPLALFSPGKRHWFTIQYKDGDKSAYILLHLDKGEYQRVILEAESRTGKNVERVLED